MKYVPIPVAMLAVGQPLPVDVWRASGQLLLRIDARAADQSWHVAWSPTLVEPKLTATERLALERRQAARGSILGANGEVLVGLKDVYRVGIDKGRISADQAQISATALATLMGTDATAYAKTVAASGPAQFVPAITLRIDDPRIAGKTAAVRGAAASVVGFVS